MPYRSFAAPPYNMAIQHRVELQFNSPLTGMPTSRLGNAYYHAYLPSLRKNWPHFTGGNMMIDLDLKTKLKLEHKQLLLINLGITI